MKKLILILVIVAVVGGYYVLSNKKNAQPEQNAMPVVGISGTAETVVEDMASQTKKFTLDGFEFGFDQKTITVKKGDIVSLTLTNSGKMPHDWVVDELDVRTKQIKNGETDSITFVADKTGTFEYYCSVGQHRANGMVGKLVVEE